MAWLSVQGILEPLESMKTSYTETGFSQWHTLLFLSPQIHCLGMNIIVNINCTWSSSEFCHFERCSCLSLQFGWSPSQITVRVLEPLPFLGVINSYQFIKALAALGYSHAVVFCCPFIPHVLLSLHVILWKKSSPFLPNNLILSFCPH